MQVMRPLTSSFLSLIALTGTLYAPPVQAAAPLALSGSYSVHDPSRIVECGGKYYVYYTGPHCPVHTSTDLIHWTDGKNVIDTLPDWALKLVPKAKGAEAWTWAPDVIKIGDLYYLFWSLSTFGSKTSVIGLCVSPTLNANDPRYHWEDKGLVVSSDTASDANAIDPCPIVDNHGALWMTYGSWNQGGIKIVKLNKETGKPTSEPISLSHGQAAGPEAPFLYYHKGYYYLFDNEGTCCQGKHSTYHIMMGRAKSIDGPYIDMRGTDMRNGGGSLFMAGDGGDTFGPGHAGISTIGGKEVLSYHYYDGTRNGWPELGVAHLQWTSSGWPKSPWKAPRSIADGTYAIISKQTGLAMTVDKPSKDNGTAIIQSPFGGTPQQAWRVAFTNDGFYKIISVDSGKALDLWTCSEADGTKIDQYSWFDNACQHWKIAKVGDNWSITSMSGGGAISTATKDSIAGTPVLEFRYKGDTSQQWEFKRLDEAGKKVSRLKPS